MLKNEVDVSSEPLDIIYGWNDLPWVKIGEADSHACLFAVDANDPEGPMLMVGDYSPNLVIPPHWHAQGHIEIVQEGLLTVGGRPETPGSIRVVPGGVKYGPLETGPEGARTLVIFPSRTVDALIGQFDPEVGFDEERAKSAFRKLGVSV